LLNKKTVDDIVSLVSGKNVLVRCDFNVPIQDGVITDDTRIVAALPTIKRLLDSGACVILCSHYGRPKNCEPEFSLAPVAKRLSELLAQHVTFLADDRVISDKVRAAIKPLKEGDVALLENTRFRAEETENCDEFSKDLASIASAFVMDAFGVAHRAHSSTVGVIKYMDISAIGYLMKKEVEYLGSVVNNPERPFVSIVGGAKVSDKIDVLNILLEKVDILIIGGGMAYTFIKAMGYEIGKSLLEEDKLDYAKELIQKAAAHNVRLILPIDTVIAAQFSNDADFKNVSIDKIDPDWIGVDIGSETIKLFTEVLKDAKTVIWNGPMGVFEMDNFAKGTIAVADALSKIDAITVIGGGDSAAAVTQLGYSEKMSHISTGGGASLKFLEGKVLPGLACVQNRKARKRLVVGNWKMNFTPCEAAEFASKFAPKLIGDADVALCVPFVSIGAVCTAVSGTNISVGAQNMHFEKKGAFTGEISAEMLLEIGAKYVIIGHSERRQYFGETDKSVSKKLAKALRCGLIPIVCVGESLEEHKDEITVERVRTQVKRAYLGISASDAVKTVIAYEPIWAIGTGKTATSEQAEEACAAIRALLEEMYGKETAEKVRILYGGSVSEANAKELFAMDNIDGGLVGGASLKDEFEVIVKA